MSEYIKVSKAIFSSASPVSLPKWVHNGGSKFDHKVLERQFKRTILSSPLLRKMSPGCSSSMKDKEPSKRLSSEVDRRRTLCVYGHTAMISTAMIREVQQYCKPPSEQWLAPNFGHPYRSDKRYMMEVAFAQS